MYYILSLSLLFTLSLISSHLSHPYQSIRDVPLSSLQGRKIAIDASMSIYQFLIAVRSGGPNVTATQLTNEQGETTSHIQGMFNRTIRYMQEGIQPVFCFDGKPPSIKSGELQKRREKRIKAQEQLKVAEEEGNVEEQDKQNKRLVRAGQKENDDCKKLLSLMGVPIINAPCEAEAQAAYLAKSGLVYATGTEDMDALTFQTPVLVRKMTFASSKDKTIQTISYKKALEGLELTHDEFVDLCILLGCDYCDSIRGVGPKTALKLIKQHHSIENILQHLDRDKYGVPEDWIPAETSRAAKKLKKEEDYNTEDEDKEEEEEGVARAKVGDDDDDEEEADMEPIYVKARRLFNQHEVMPKEQVQLKWNPCQPAELTKFLVEDMGFNADRVKSSIEKLQKAHKANAKPQSRMDSFFQVKANPNKPPSKKKAAPADDKKKSGGFFGKRKR
jgi:flap endonuclease-1